MKERPILFSDTEVRAILEGRKTQTRRVGKIQSDAFTELGVQSIGHATKGHVLQATYLAFPGKGSARWAICECPYGTVGDRLWIRESFAIIASRAWYRADPPTVDGKAYEGPWRPSIHMPRWASRITLEITGVRVERLQDISEEDAIAEGCICPNYGIDDYWKKAGDPDTPADVFMALWQSINGPDSWSANPWVWVIEFKRLETA